MEKVIFISIIVPCYNAEETIKATAHNLIDEFESASLKFPELQWEIIAVNDGSTDNTLNILNLIKSSCNHIKIVNKNNSGVSETRNYGLKEAKGKYIWFFDADDLLFSGSVTGVVSYLMNDPDILQFSSVTLDNKTKSYIDNFNNSNTSEILYEGKYENRLLSNRFNFSCWSVIVKRQLLLENQIDFNNEYVICEDVLWNLTVALKCKDSFINISNLNVVKYVVRENSAVNATDNNRVFNQMNGSIKFFYELQRDIYKEDYLSPSINFYSETTLNQIITRFLSCNLNLKKIRENRKKINGLLSGNQYNNKVIKFYNLISRNSFLSKMAQIFYRYFFLKYIKPKLARN